MPGFSRKGISDKTPIVTLVVGGMIVMLGTSGAAQHEGHQMPGMTIDSCREQSQQAISVIDAANQRLELARQTNNLSEMRAAVDALQSALGQIKEQLRPCAAPADSGGAAASSMPGMQHNMPGMQHGTSGVTAPGTPTVTAASPTPPAPPTTLGSDDAGVATATQSKTTSTGQAATSARLDIIFKSVPSPAKVGNNQFEVTVKQNGKEIGQKKLTVTAR